jgi:hypothetical protein
MCSLRFRIGFLVAVVSVISVSSSRATTISVAQAGNVLAAATAVSSTSIAAPFPASAAVDDAVRAVPPADQDHGLIFDNGDQSQRLGLSGSFGAIQEIRIWTIPVAADERIPHDVLVRSSTTAYTGASLITSGNFETLLGSFPLGIGAFTGTSVGTDNTYATVFVNAPAGTQSLYLDFGADQQFKGERITEVQAFVPEPSAMALAACGLMLSMTGARCRRKR